MTGPRERARRAIAIRVAKAAWSSRLLRLRVRAWAAARRHRDRYPVLREEELRELRRSDTCFVFGSGSSLDEITPGEWDAISAHGTIAFNYFIRSRFVRVDFHLVGEMASFDDADETKWKNVVREYAQLVEENPFYARTVLGLQEGLPALQSNRLLASGHLSATRRTFRYRRIARGVLRPPSPSLAEGLVHGAGSLVGCINLATILGFRDIVLAGIDLYDRRVFDSREPGLVERLHPTLSAPDARHGTAATMVDYLGRWRPLLEERGISLSVYNPRSLLAGVMPVKPKLA